MNQMKAAKRREEISPGRKGLLPKAAKRQQNLAQGVSPGFDFRVDTSREAAADASNLPPLRGYDMDEHEPPALAPWAIVSRRFAAGQQPRKPWARIHFESPAPKGRQKIGAAAPSGARLGADNFHPRAYALGYFLAPLRGWANLFPPLRDVFAAAATIVA